MKFNIDYTITRILGLLVLSSVLLSSCASNSLSTHIEEIEVPLGAQELPSPLLERYPFIGGNNHDLMTLKPDFECTEQTTSSLLDEQEPVSISFIEMDIIDALLELSLITGVTILTDDSVFGIVTINFQEKPFEEVLQAILTPGNFGYKAYDSYIYVGSPSPVSESFHLLSNTCVYKPVFLEPAQIVDLLTPYYRQYVSFYQGHDYLSISAPSSIQDRIQKDIRTFDQAPQQVLLEVSIVEVTSEMKDLLGVKWNAEINSSELLRDQNFGNQQSFFTFSSQNFSRNPVAQALIDSIQAINVDEAFQIHAMPSIVTINGKEANFSSTQTSWLQFNLDNNIAYRETQVDYGVRLQIVPYISKQNQIRMEIINASVSDITENYDNQPRIISHSISTSVLMMNGEALVLGGLLQKKLRKASSRVPGASATPLFGNMFRNRSDEEINTEVLIIIRPKILEEYAS